MPKNVNRVNPVLNPTALTAADAARLLGLEERIIRQHIEQGAPASAAGTINLVHYAAWLNLQLSKANT